MMLNLAAADPVNKIQAIFTSKAIILDTGNYYPSRDGKNPEIENGLIDSEWVEKIIGHPVLKAFNNINFKSLRLKSLPSGTAERVALSVAGDNNSDIKVVMNLIDAIGFDPVDAGALVDSWRQQPGEAAYCQDLSRKTLILTLVNADIRNRKDNLAAADEKARPYL